ncbi:MAG: thiol-disulfide oxidoreductase DCC family protein [Planctomycetota bacterium]|jgi:predicted DCC family thiol-disulfide oxidoreductase YuxK
MPPPDTIYYDGKCGYCRASSRRIKRLDWLGSIERVDFTELDEADLPAPMEECLRAMVMRTHDGRVLAGMPAVRRALRRTPVGLLPALVLHVPGVSHAAGWAYGIIARSRKRDVCEVVPHDEI